MRLALVVYLIIVTMLTVVSFVGILVLHEDGQIKRSADLPVFPFPLVHVLGLPLAEVVLLLGPALGLCVLHLLILPLAETVFLVAHTTLCSCCCLCT